MQAAPVGRRRRIWRLVAVLVVAGLLIMGGIGLAIWWLNDNIGAHDP
jgi:preprotein translocase subunit Sss1